MADAVSHAGSGSSGEFTQRAGARARELYETVQLDYAMSMRTVFYVMAGIMAIAFVVAAVGDAERRRRGGSRRRRHARKTGQSQRRATAWCPGSDVGASTTATASSWSGSSAAATTASWIALAIAVAEQAPGLGNRSLDAVQPEQPDRGAARRDAVRMKDQPLALLQAALMAAPTRPCRLGYSTRSAGSAER